MAEARKVYTMAIDGTDYDLQDALDPSTVDDIYTDAAGKRTGSEHEEEPHKHGKTTCEVCGDVGDASNNPDPQFHPEAYV